MEFWSTINLKEAPEQVQEQLTGWQHFSNHDRPHPSIGSKTPFARLQELLPLVPTPEEVRAAYVTLRSYSPTNHSIWFKQHDP